MVDNVYKSESSCSLDKLSASRVCFGERRSLAEWVGWQRARKIRLIDIDFRSSCESAFQQIFRFFFLPCVYNIWLVFHHPISIHAISSCSHRWYHSYMLEAIEEPNTTQHIPKSLTSDIMDFLFLMHYWHSICSVVQSSCRALGLVNKHSAVFRDPETTTSDRAIIYWCMCMHGYGIVLTEKLQFWINGKQTNWSLHKKLETINEKKTFEINFEEFLICYERNIEFFSLFYPHNANNHNRLIVMWTMCISMRHLNEMKILSVLFK